MFTYPTKYAGSPATLPRWPVQQPEPRQSSSPRYYWHQSDLSMSGAFNPQIGDENYYSFEDVDFLADVPRRQTSPLPGILNGQIPIETVILTKQDNGHIVTWHDGKDGDTSYGNVMSPHECSYNDSGFESDVSVGSPWTPSQYTNDILTTFQSNASPLTKRPLSSRKPIPKKRPILKPLITSWKQQNLKRKLDTYQASPSAPPCKKRRGSYLPPATPLHKDLDVIFISIRRIFFFNCFAFSNRNIIEERNHIVAEMKATSQSYSYHNLVEEDIRQDFSSWQVRWGYMFMYFLRHAHLVYLSLKLFRLCTNIFLPRSSGWNIPYDSGRWCSNFFLQKCTQPDRVLQVCAIGGGPGSDLIGLALFLRAFNFPVKISVCVFDLCGHWQESWNSLIDQLPTYLAKYFLKVRYVPFDYLYPSLSCEQSRIISTADLITVVKSLSPVASKLAMFKPSEHIQQSFSQSNSLCNILSTASPGTVVLYVDNKFGKQCKVMQDAIKSAKGYRLLHYQVTKEELPSKGFSETSREFMKWVGYGPSFFSGRNEVVVLGRQ